MVRTRRTDKVSEITAYDFLDVQNVQDIPLATPEDVIFRPEYVYLQDDDLFIGHYPGLSKWTIENDVATLAADGAVEPQFPPANDYAFVSPVGNLVVATSDHDVKSKVNIGIHQVEPDRKGPELKYVLPKPGQRNVSIHGKIGMSFSDFIDGGCLEHGAVLIREKGSGRMVSCNVSHGLGIVHAVPTVLLSENTSYEVLVTKQLLDLVGNPYEGQELVTTFSTGDELSNYSCSIATDQPRVVGQSVRLQAGINNTDMKSTVVYSWDFGDGSEPTEFSVEDWVERDFSQAGNYNITLTAKERGQDRLVKCSAVQVVHAVLPPTTPVASSSIYLEDAQKRLFVVNPDNDTFTALDTVSGLVIYEQATDAKPVSIIRHADQLWISCQQSDAIAIHSADTGERVETIRLKYGSAPHGLTIDEQSGRCYVALSATGLLQEIDAATMQLTRQIKLAGPLRNLAWIPEKQIVAAPQFIAGDQKGATLQWVDVNQWAVTLSKKLSPSMSNDGQSNGRGYPNYLGSIAVNPEQTRMWIPGKKDNLFRGLQRDGEPLVFDQTVRSTAVAVDLESGTEIIEQRIDLDNSDFATTTSFNRRGNVLYIATMGTSTITAVDAYHPGDTSVFNTYGQGAMAIVGNQDGDRLYVHNQLSRSISVFESQPDGSLHYLSQWNTVENEKLSADVLSGKRLFHDTSRSHLSREGYMSCASCHIDGSHDGRVWDLSNLGEGLRNTIDLRGKAGMKHGILHWTGNFDEVQDFDDQIRRLNQGTGFLFDAVKNPQRKFFPHKAGMIAELDNLAKYVSSLSEYPKSPFKDSDGKINPSAVNGRDHFIALKCYTCHSGKTFTDSVSGIRHDVGTQSIASGHRLGEPLSGFDTPTLIGLWQSAPYLHDGSAATLADVFCVGQGDQADAHNVVAQLNDTDQQELFDYLMQLDSEEGVTAQDVASRNAKPSFERSEHKFEYAYRYDRRTHPVGTVVATDADTDQSLAYRIAPSVYSNLFTIDSATGEIQFEFKDIYFRDIANQAFDESRTYSLVVTAEDDGDFVQKGSTRVVVEVLFPKLLIENKELNRFKRLNAMLDTGKTLKSKDQKELAGILEKIRAVY